MGLVTLQKVLKDSRYQLRMGRSGEDMCHTQDLSKRRGSTEPCILYGLGRLA